MNVFHYKSMIKQYLVGGSVCNCLPSSVDNKKQSTSYVFGEIKRNMVHCVIKNGPYHVSLARITLR